MQYEKFNKSDLKIVKKDYLGNLLPTIGFFLLLVLISFIYFSIKGTIGLYFFFSVVISIVLSIILFSIITRKHQLDLKNQNVELKKSKIKDKVYKKIYEPGSATVPVNFLSLLFFKKIFLREMKGIEVYYIAIDETKIFTYKNDFDKIVIGEEIIVRWSEFTQLFLGIIKNNQHIRIKKASGLNRLYI